MAPMCPFVPLRPGGSQGRLAALPVFPFTAPVLLAQQSIRTWESPSPTPRIHLPVSLSVNLDVGDSNHGFEKPA